MALTPETRKLLSELTREDLDAFPIWKYVLKESGGADLAKSRMPGEIVAEQLISDEGGTQVQPVEGNMWSGKGADLILGVTFVSADGTEYIGCLEPNVDDQPGLLLHDGKAIDLPRQANLKEAEELGCVEEFRGDQETSASELGVKVEALFPLKWKVMAMKKGKLQPLEGVIGGEA